MIDASGHPHGGRGWTIGAVAVVGIVLVFGWIAVRASRDEDSAGGPPVIRVAMGMGGFEPAEIRVPRGEPVTLRFHVPADPAAIHGIGEHQFAIDELGVDLVVASGDSASLTVTPDTTGRYEFYCDACCGGRSNPTMRGTLIVEGV